MKILVFVLCIVFSSLCNAQYVFTVDRSAPYTTSYAANMSCSAVKAAAQATLNAGGGGYTVTTCSSDPVVVGTKINWTPTSTWTVQTIACASAYHMDGGVCVADVPTTVCVPSGRTVTPCPSGYAPQEVSVTGASGTSVIYSSSLDSLPLQEIVYAVALCFGGLFGIAVGVKLI